MNRAKYLILLHLIVIIFGFTGILGKEISLSSIPLVFFRMLIAAAALLLYLAIIRKPLLIGLKKLIQYALVGAVIAAHWICFFESIKVSNVSVALATMASTSLFVSFLEPLFYSRKPKAYEVLLGLAVIIGLVMIFSFETEYTLGISLALLSAALAALFSTVNSRLIKSGDALRISLYELFFGFIAVGVYLFLSGDVGPSLFEISSRDLWLLLILGTVATAFAFVVSVEVMKELSPFTVSLSINLEPVYSIFLALLFYGDEERMTGGFYLGTIIILSTLFVNAILKQRERKKNNQEGIVQ